MQETTHEILENIYLKLDPAIILPELEPHLKGNYYTITCPRCKKREAYIYLTGNYIACNRANKCGFGQSLWKYIEERDQLSKQETLRYLAKAAGVSLPLLKDRDEQTVYAYKKRSELTDELQQFFTSQLWSDEGVNTLSYLFSRGYSASDIQLMELGFNPGFEAIQKHLEKNGHLVTFDHGLKVVVIDGDNEILANIEWRDNYQLVFPYRDVFGRIKAFWARTSELESKRKYLPLSGGELAKKDVLFNLYHARTSKTVILVEGFLDALLATAQGMKNVVAVASAQLQNKQIESAKRYGIEDFILAFDSDVAGQKGVEGAIEKLTNYGLNCCVCTIPHPFKDPDELIRSIGIDSFISLVSNPEHYTKWKARRILGRYNLSTDIGISQCFGEAQKYGSSLNKPLDITWFWDTISGSLNISPVQLNEFLSVQIKKKEVEKSIKRSTDFVERARVQLESGNIDAYKALLQNAAGVLSVPNKTSIPLDQYLEDKYQRESSRTSPLLGYPLQQLQSISKNIDGIQPGFYIIAAETNIGKTALLTNLFLDLLTTNQHLKGLYFSLDDSKDVIINRFVSNISGVKINRLQKKTSDPEEAVAIAKAYETLKLFAGSQRLLLKDISEISTVEQLEQDIQLEAESGELIVVIDGLYNLGMDTKRAGIREENIDRANKVKALVDTYKIPIICTGEIRKAQIGTSKDREPTINDLMETGKFAYNANLVLLLYPQDVNEFATSDIATLNVKFAKNKLSHFKGTLQLKFHKQKSFIEDPNAILVTPSIL